jgi:hypothetical protein
LRALHRVEANGTEGLDREAEEVTEFADLTPFGGLMMMMMMMMAFGPEPPDEEDSSASADHRHAHVRELISVWESVSIIYKLPYLFRINY